MPGGRARPGACRPPERRGQPESGAENADAASAIRPVDQRCRGRAERRAHEARGHPEARLARKGRGKEAKLCYAGHTLIENRHGLIVALELTQASGTAEREAGLRLVARQRGDGRGRMSVAADKGYDTADFVAGVRALRVTPHVARKKRFSAIDGRTTRHRSYAVSLRRRKLIEEGYGWMKDIGGLRKLRHRGKAKVSALFTFTCAAYNLVRLRTLLAEPAPA